jgi:hypothetical protein
MPTKFTFSYSDFSLLPLFGLVPEEVGNIAKLKNFLPSFYARYEKVVVARSEFETGGKKILDVHLKEAGIDTANTINKSQQDSEFPVVEESYEIVKKLKSEETMLKLVLDWLTETGSAVR